ncbi:MAG TPA: hypothetical protein VEO95_02715 [Chthoniobacteraceae bacterium]|nr:hypothetical protein [Chthoniobacteraceae bacterium]
MVAAQKYETAPAGETPVKGELVNPQITATLRADYKALKNDVQQANELAAHFQRELAGRSNEFAQLKQLFDKTTADLAHLQTAITALREERHRLANEAMRAAALQLKLTNTTAERDRLRIELEMMREALATAVNEKAEKAEAARERDARMHERDAQFAELTIQVVTLKEALAQTQRSAAQTPPARRVKTASAERLLHAEE